jgi:hypothetical protein
MHHPEQPDLPAWALEERQGDLDWIRENTAVFQSAAAEQYQKNGRGIIMVDLRSRPPGGHYFTYYLQEFLVWEEDEAISRMVEEYDPAAEFVVTLIKSNKRLSTYRIQPQQQTAEGPLIVDHDNPVPAATSKPDGHTEASELEKQEDYSWIVSNRCLFWLVATAAHDQIGRGAIMVDTTSNAPSGNGNPFTYQTEGEIELRDETLSGHLQTYMPDREFVIVLLKTDGQFNSYLGTAPLMGWWANLHTDTKRYI